MQKISIIIPTLNEADNIVTLLQPLQPYRQKGHEVIVVDGGSNDNTAALATNLSDKVLNSPAGRAAQMNAGAAAAGNDTLLFVHADTQLPNQFDEAISRALAKHAWGRFDVQLSGKHWMFPVIAFFINARSRLSGIATGDQAIFVEKSAFNAINGYPNIRLMEDIVLAKRLRAKQPPACLRDKVVTSSRRWSKHGIWKTIFLMWRIRFAFWQGADPAQLAARYSNER